ncbi:ATP-binding protein [Erysipelothrix rhusiopathiae]|uniref:ATP-binding protein n=1 Tax=Erysipelothrix rhusiopathiae TaxID=1648 RepID=UPI001EE11282|nr:ATP-binding protein [Erysipelothrix rhusiopathiae]MCG4437254.1 ATP-binding protein [Erysipelothrix rhusiopathiae]
MPNNETIRIENEKLSVSGKVVEEHSRLVPSTKFAIIELMKNSYEAGASNITINMYDDRLVLEDDGSGMGIEEIRALLVLSQSTKEFGSTVNGRLVSGEKGLGFYSVFKFGDNVAIETTKNGLVHSFELNMKEIGNLKNIHNYDVKIPVSPSKDAKSHGTTITITSLDTDSYDLFKEVITRPQEYAKLSSAIIDDKFSIVINPLWDEQIGKDIKKNLEFTNHEKKIISTLSFDSREMYDPNKKVFYYNQEVGDQKITYQLPKEINQLLESSSIHANINLNVYKFVAGDVKKSNPLFINDKGDGITPILFINNCYFDNQDFYDANINASTKTDRTFRQQTGIINIRLFDSNIINFNSDRTQIIESRNQKLLKSLLDTISITMQSNIKDVTDQIESKKPKCFNKSIYKGKELSSLKPSFSIDDIDQIYFENSAVDQFNSELLGDWKIIMTNKDQYLIKVVDYPNATIRFTKKELIVGNQLILDDFISVTDCKGGKSIAINTVGFSPQTHISFDQKTGIINLLSHGILNVKITGRDKISEKTFEFDNSIPVVPRSEQVHFDNNCFYSLIDINVSNFDSAISELISEMNAAYSNNNHHNMFICSLRPLVEIITDRALKKRTINRVNYLSENLKTLFNRTSDLSMLEFIQSVKDERDKKLLVSLHDDFKKKINDDVVNFLANLNITTHSAGSVLNLETIKPYFPFVNFIYTYLLWIYQ